VFVREKALLYYERESGNGKWQKSNAVIIFYYFSPWEINFTFTLAATTVAAGLFSNSLCGGLHEFVYAHHI
jgi:hypothetical protein